MTETEKAEAFVAAFPWAPMEHAVYIARVKAEQGVPFCEECADWHFADEQHSMES